MAVTIPDRVREGLICEKIPKGNKEARLAYIWEESISRRDSTVEIYLVYLWKSKRSGD